VRDGRLRVGCRSGVWDRRFVVRVSRHGRRWTETWTWSATFERIHMRSRFGLGLGWRAGKA
jgi:hypothetical protein